MNTYLLVFFLHILRRAGALVKVRSWSFWLLAVYAPGSAGVSPASVADQKPVPLGKRGHPERMALCHQTR
jgi:hypothetical protein